MNKKETLFYLKDVIQYLDYDDIIYIINNTVSCYANNYFVSFLFDYQNQSKLQIYFQYGNQFWFKHNRYHRQGRPAVIYPIRNKQYYYEHGQLKKTQ